MRVILITILLISLLLSCSRPSVSVDELQRYILDEKNGLLKTVCRENTIVALFFRPVELMTIQEIMTVNDPVRQNEIKMKYRDYAYFILRLSENKEEYLNQFARKEEHYPEALRYFSEGIGDHLMLLSGQSKISPDFVTLMQSFGISDHTDIMIAFRTEGLHEKQDFKITLADSEFIPGFYEFIFKAKEIRCAPLLNPLSYEAI